MGLFKKSKKSKEIDLTKLRGKIKVKIEKHKGKNGGEYYSANVYFEDGTKLLVDMQLIELLSSKLHGQIRKDNSELFSSEMSIMDELVELISGDEIRDTILEAIYD